MLDWTVISFAALLGLTLTGGARGQVRYPCEDTPRNEVVLLNHATSCSKYVICIAGEAAIRDCAPGLRFDIEAGQCQVDGNCVVEDLDCPLYDDPEELIFHSNLDFCNRYSLCVGGEPRQLECARGLHWDPDNEWCTFPNEVDCPVAVECPDEGVAYLPHPTICQKFFICMNGNKERAECADGLIFDVERNTCFFEHLSTCIIDWVEPGTQSTTIGESETDEN